MDKLAVLAGYTGSAILGKMHEFRAKDERKEEMGEGLSPAQVALDQAAHLMDAIAMSKLILCIYVDSSTVLIYSYITYLYSYTYI